MDFSIPDSTSEDIKRFKQFLDKQMKPHLTEWYDQNKVPHSFHKAMGENGWLGFDFKDGRLARRSALTWVMAAEALAVVSPGVAVATLAHVDLGIMALWLFAADALHAKYGPDAIKGKTLLCLGNTETHAGSDVANIDTRAEKVSGGWRLNGVKAYVTNGLISDFAVITAVSDPDAPRNSRLSMFLVDMSAEGVTRKKLNKKVWIPSDLTRITMKDVFVPDDHLVGERGKGLQQVLSIFMHSRVTISGLTTGTALGAFELAVKHAQTRDIFGTKIADLEAKSFEIADYYAKIEAARLMLQKAAWTMEQGKDFRLEASLAKYLAVAVARDVCSWAADMFGAASVVFEHPVHKFPMDAWASSLGEGTQDVQKLVIFREVMRKYKK
jgi:short-chain 2-methylacyl-CoA dehydrogenase